MCPMWHIKSISYWESPAHMSTRTGRLRKEGGKPPFLLSQAGAGACHQLLQAFSSYAYKLPLASFPTCPGDGGGLLEKEHRQTHALHGDTSIILFLFVPHHQGNQSGRQGGILEGVSPLGAAALPCLPSTTHALLPSGSLGGRGGSWHGNQSINQSVTNVCVPGNHFSLSLSL